MELSSTKQRLQRQQQQVAEQDGSKSKQGTSSNGGSGSSSRGKKAAQKQLKLDRAFWECFLALPAELSTRILALAGWHMTRVSKQAPLAQFDSLYAAVFDDAQLTMTWLIQRHNAIQGEHAVFLVRRTLHPAARAGKTAVVAAGLEGLISFEAREAKLRLPDVAAAPNSAPHKGHLIPECRFGVCSHQLGVP
jgi:hypothetical protein